MRALVLLLPIATCGCSDRISEPHTPRELLAVCSPGHSWESCRRATDVRQPLPAGRLQKVVHAFSGFEPDRIKWGAVNYQFVFEGDSSDVVTYLEEQFGTRTTAVPEHFPAQVLIQGKHWLTPDGVWEIYGHTVVWYSKPFEMRLDMNNVERLGFDDFLYRAPITEAIWQHLGAMLVGVDKLDKPSR